MPARILITVAEPSADRHAADLVHALRATDPTLLIDALGGPALAAAGATVLLDTVSNAAMGPAALARAAEARRMVALVRHRHTDPATRPDLHIAVDSWSLNWRFATSAKSAGIPVLYYIAPQTWASRESRVRKLATLVDRLACILPFEEAYFRNHGVPASYVGHPLFATPFPPPPPRPPGPPVVGILPGSRRSIAAANWPRLLRVMAGLRTRFPGIAFLVPTTANTDAIVRRMPLAADVTAELDAFDRFVPRCDLCLTVSGTAALHVAAHRVPLIVVYHGNPILWHLVARWIVKTRTYSLVNILRARQTPPLPPIAPEFIPWYGPTTPVENAAADLLASPQRLADIRRQLDAVVRPLESSQAAQNTARLAFELLQKSKAASESGAASPRS